MRAMVLEPTGGRLVCHERAVPQPGPGQILIRVAACAVCRTDLHLADGDLPRHKPDVVPGHEVVGRVMAVGPGASRFQVGDRIGVPWLGWACGSCAWCRSGRENLCPQARFTGCDLDGGFADLMVAWEDFCFALPPEYGDAEAAPLLCAGLIGYRAWRMAGDADRVGFYGFGAAAHILTQIARYEGRQVFAFTRPGDADAQRFALSLGAAWAGSSDEPPPVRLDAAIIFAPAGPLAPLALAAVEPGGRVVCAGIHMSEIPAFPYSLLWGERSVCSVANLTRSDGEAFLELAPKAGVRTIIQPMALTDANLALDRLRRGDIEGAAVLVL